MVVHSSYGEQASDCIIRHSMLKKSKIVLPHSNCHILQYFSSPFETMQVLNSYIYFVKYFCLAHFICLCRDAVALGRHSLITGDRKNI